jgi:hypothetical protein
MKFLRCICLILLILVCFNQEVLAESLSDRVAKFPQWESKPEVKIASGDLYYPEWMEGTWQVTSTLVDLAAPLAPKIVTPGFESNRNYLDRSIAFPVKFKKISVFQVEIPLPIVRGKIGIIADRQYNGLKIAKAYLGERVVLSVKVDPDNPNRQVTFLSGDRQLSSSITGRASEIPQTDRFIATEITQQIFQGSQQIYLNEVETTTDYHLIDLKTIEADQITAIYLSPKDPDYFQAQNRPVALYRYHLKLNH